MLTKSLALSSIAWRERQREARVGVWGAEVGGWALDSHIRFFTVADAAAT